VRWPQSWGIPRRDLPELLAAIDAAPECAGLTARLAAFASSASEEEADLVLEIALLLQVRY